MYMLILGFVVDWERTKGEEIKMLRFAWKGYLILMRTLFLVEKYKFELVQVIEFYFIFGYIVQMYGVFFTFYF